MEMAALTTILYGMFAVAMVTPPVLADVAWMRQALLNSFSRSRHMIYPGNRTVAQDFIKRQFTEMNLDVHLHNYTASIDGYNGTFTAVNIVGILKGKHFNTTDDTIYAIGAHYDTVATGPGVDDNGAGVVVMLEAARALAAQGQGRRNSTVLFIAFDLEEYYNGSAVLVRDWLPTLRGWQVGWRGIYVLDTVFNFDETPGAQKLPGNFSLLFPGVAQRIQADNNKGNFIGAIARQTVTEQDLLVSLNTSWFKQGSDKYKIEVMPIPVAVLSNPEAIGHLIRSDHVNFWNARKEAIFITDTADFRGYMAGCYHQACDDSTHINDTNLQFALRLANSLADVINTYAPADATSSSGGLHLGNTLHLGLTFISMLAVYICVSDISLATRF